MAASNIAAYRGVFLNIVGVIKKGGLSREKPLREPPGNQSMLRRLTHRGRNCNVWEKLIRSKVERLPVVLPHENRFGRAAHLPRPNGLPRRGRWQETRVPSRRRSHVSK